jgi:hypothetical protein
MTPLNDAEKNIFRGFKKQKKSIMTNHQRFSAKATNNSLSFVEVISGADAPTMATWQPFK